MNAIALVLGVVIGLGVKFLVDAFVIKPYPLTRWGNLQWRLSAHVMKMVGMPLFYDRKARALRCFHMAARLLVETDTSVEVARTTLAMEYSSGPRSDPAETLRQLAAATILAAHVQRVRLGDEICKLMAALDS